MTFNRAHRFSPVRLYSFARRAAGRNFTRDFFFFGACVVSASSHAETISRALVQAYTANPDLNQQRANVRITDEDVSRANAGFRPRVNGAISAGVQRTEVGVAGQTVRSTTFPRNLGFQVQQTLFDGNRTFNSVRQAESQVFGAREVMRLTEQSILLSAASNYMNVLRDTAILNLRRSNIAVLAEQLRQTRDRFEAGQVTRTDLAQSDAALAQARSDFFAAQANLQASTASYRQVVGSEPRRLEPAQSVERLLPRRLTDAVEASQVEHPAIVAALHNVDAASLAVRIAEGALFPTVTLNGSVNQAFGAEGGSGESSTASSSALTGSSGSSGSSGSRVFTASIIGQINIPLYQGGGEYAQIRQAKEQVSQIRLNADLQRDQVRASVVTAWGQLETAKAQIASGQAATAAAEIALSGIREEARVGQRTTFDILNAQQVLLNARVNLVVAQRDRVVASYSVLASMGRLSADKLALNVNTFDPTSHFDQVKDKPFGLRTPDGR